MILEEHSTWFIDVPRRDLHVKRGEIDDARQAFNDLLNRASQYGWTRQTASSVNSSSTEGSSRQATVSGNGGNRRPIAPSPGGSLAGCCDLVRRGCRAPQTCWPPDDRAPPFERSAAIEPKRRKMCPMLPKMREENAAAKESGKRDAVRATQKALGCRRHG